MNKNYKSDSNCSAYKNFHNNNNNISKSNFTNNYSSSTSDSYSQVSNTINNSNNKSNSDNIEFLEFFGIRLYFDDLLILALLFFLYNQNVDDPLLFISLVLLLLS
jgi:hypothetical protein